MDNLKMPPKSVARYKENIPAETTVELFQTGRQGFLGLVIHARSSHDLKIHVEHGVSSGEGIEWVGRRTYSLVAGASDGDGLSVPQSFTADAIRVLAENASDEPTTSFLGAGYLTSILADISHIQKPVRTLWDSETLAAGSGDNFSPVLDLSNSLGGQLTLVMTNGATGPTVAPTAFLQSSSDGGTTWGDWSAIKPVANSNQTFPTTANAVTTVGFQIPHTVRHARVRAGGNTSQPVTISVNANLAHY